MATRKEDKLRRLAEIQAARMLNRSLEGQRACEALRKIGKANERERSHHNFLFFRLSDCYLIKLRFCKNVGVLSYFLTLMYRNLP